MVKIGQEVEMNFVKSIMERARREMKRIVLPEGDDIRTVQAAVLARTEGIADIILLGNEAIINQNARQLNVDISGIKIIKPEDDHNFNEFVSLYFQKRRHKGLTQGKAHEIMKHPLYFGAAMVDRGLVDGSVAGAVNTTGDVLRAALHLVGMTPGINTVSSCFIMVLPQKIAGIDHQIFTFADSGVVPQPTTEQLAAIAVISAKSHKALVGEEPVVAMLSFSTKGSAEHEDIDKVIEATRLAKEMDPALNLDGELQGDAALLASVGSRKAPGSPVAGKANVLIFPDLDAGNIAYKLVQRLAGADAYGPILQGLDKPCHDLSRGCNADDILTMIAIAVAQTRA